jgi:hypothetical protein
VTKNSNNSFKNNCLSLFSTLAPLEANPPRRRIFATLGGKGDMAPLHACSGALFLSNLGDDEFRFKHQDRE